MWDIRLCESCVGPDEADELENGKPTCRASGKCKHLRNNLRASDLGLGCNPLNHVSAGGLYRFFEVASRAVWLSPVNEIGMPSMAALGWMDWEVDMSPEIFEDCLDAWWTAQAQKRKSKAGD